MTEDPAQHVSNARSTRTAEELAAELREWIEEASSTREMDCLGPLLALSILLGKAREAERHRCQLPESIQQALNSGDGSYKP